MVNDQLARSNPQADLSNFKEKNAVALEAAAVYAF